MSSFSSPAFKKQTIIVEDGDDSHTPVYRANPENMYGKKLSTKLFKVHPEFPSVDTIHTAFQSGYNFGPTNRCLGYRPFNNGKLANKYDWITYGEVEVLRNALGSGLMHLSQKYCQNNIPDAKNFEKGYEIPSEAFRNIGIISVNRREWTIFDLACAAYSRINVPIYDTFGQDAIEYIINHANLAIVLASADKMPLVLACAKNCPCLKVVICIDSVDQGDILKEFLKLDNNGLAIFKNNNAHAKPSTALSSTSPSLSPSVPITTAKFKDYLLLLQSWATNNKVQFFTFDQVLHIGRNNPVAHIPPTPQDIATISYTSGTTGNPKGAVLNHLNFASMVVFPVFAGIKWIPEDDCLISYLPLAHIFGRVSELTTLVCGARIGYYSGDTLKIVEDIGILQPTFFPSVPRLLNRVFIQIQQSTVKKGGLVGYLFIKAFQTKIENLKHQQNWHSIIDNSPLFIKLRRVLGGRLRVIITGSAPIDDTVLTFLRACFGCVFVQGYGQTESTAGNCVSIVDDYDCGHTGVPVPCNEIKLRTVVDLNYTVKDVPFPRGEVMIRGYNVFQGYWREPLKTKEALKDGWLYTGDVGEMDKYGRLRIIDRIKNLFKLSQGEYIAVEKVEGVYAKNSLIMQLFVHGDSLQSYLVAIVIPNPPVFKELVYKLKNVVLELPVDMQKAYLDPKYREMCEDKSVKEAIFASINTTGLEGKLKGFEMIKKIVIKAEPMTIENGLMTPSFKTKRNVAKEHYQADIKQMYGGELK